MSRDCFLLSHFENIQETQERFLSCQPFLFILNQFKKEKFSFRGHFKILNWLGFHITAELSKVKAIDSIIILFIIRIVFLAAIIVLIAKILLSPPM